MAGSRPQVLWWVYPTIEGQPRVVKPQAVFRIDRNLVPVVGAFGRAGWRCRVAKQALWPGQGPDRLLDAGNEGVVVLTRLRSQRVAEGDAGVMPAGNPAKTREDFIEAVDISRHDRHPGIDG